MRPTVHSGRCDINWTHPATVWQFKADTLTHSCSQLGQVFTTFQVRLQEDRAFQAVSFQGARLVRAQGRSDVHLRDAPQGHGDGSSGDAPPFQEGHDHCGRQPLCFLLWRGMPYSKCTHSANTACYNRALYQPAPKPSLSAQECRGSLEGNQRYLEDANQACSWRRPCRCIIASSHQSLKAPSCEAASQLMHHSMMSI